MYFHGQKLCIFGGRFQYHLIYSASQSLAPVNPNILAKIDQADTLVSLKTIVLDAIQTVFIKPESIDKTIYSGPINDIVSYIAENCNNKSMSLETISLLFSINSSYLSRLFKKETGRNLTEYINLCRVDKSKHMLRDSNKLIYQIAEESGFSSVEHFTRMFKRIVGKSPSEFRKYRIP